jgi:hypothetical protein
VVIEHLLVLDHFWIENLSVKCLPIRTLLYVSFKHILINLTSFMGTGYRQSKSVVCIFKTPFNSGLQTVNKTTQMINILPQ